MAALLLKVGDLDLTSYVRAQPDEGLAPDGGGTFLEQQFGGTLALSEGQVSVGESAANKQLGAPLWLNGADTDAVLALLSELRAACVRGAQVQFRPEGASRISYLDLEAADIHPKYNHFTVRAGWYKVDLVLHCRPYATTGTYRSVASFTGTGPTIGQATGILGDVAADTITRIKSAGAGGNDYFQLCALYTRPSSFRPVVDARSGLLAVDPGGTIIGGSGAIGSQFARIPAHESANWSASLPRGDLLGRNRLLAIARTNSSYVASALLTVYSDGGPVVGQGAFTQRSASQWEVIDLGAHTVASSTADAGYTVTKSIWDPVAGASDIYVDLNAIVVVPEDNPPLIAVTDSDPLLGAAWLEYRSRPFDAWSTDSAGQVNYDIQQHVRGGPLRLPAVASGVATAAQMLVMAGNPKAYLGNASIEARLSCQERFTFFRS